MLDSILASGLTLPAFLVCTAVSLVLGIATAFLSMYRSKCSQGFAVTVAVLPAIGGEGFVLQSLVVYKLGFVNVDVVKAL